MPPDSAQNLGFSLSTHQNNNNRGDAMKYFRHLTTGRNGDRLKPLYAEFGKVKGYGLYFLLLELCAEKYNGKQEVFRFLEKELRNDLELSKKSLESLLKLLKNYQLVSDYVFTQDSRVVELTMPDLIEIADDYAKKVRTKSDKNPQNVHPYNKNKKKKKIYTNMGSTNDPTSGYDFLLVYEKYPVRIKGENAEKRFHEQIKTDEDFARLSRALDNYLAFLEIESWRKPKQSFAAFLGTKASGYFWRDFINWEPPKKKGDSASEAFKGLIREDQGGAL
jgi:hypothetical protein